MTRNSTWAHTHADYRLQTTDFRDSRWSRIGISIYRQFSRAEIWLNKVKELWCWLAGWLAGVPFLILEYHHISPPLTVVPSSRIDISTWYRTWEGSSIICLVKIQKDDDHVDQVLSLSLYLECFPSFYFTDSRWLVKTCHIYRWEKRISISLLMNWYREKSGTRSTSRNQRKPNLKTNKKSFLLWSVSRKIFSNQSMPVTNGLACWPGCCGIVSGVAPIKHQELHVVGKTALALITAHLLAI